MKDLISFICSIQELKEETSCEPRHDKTNKISVRPAKTQISLGICPVWSSVFAVPMKKAWVLSYPLSTQRRLWSDLADAQADLSLRWAHSHFVGFVMSWLMYFIVELPGSSCAEVQNQRNISSHSCCLSVFIHVISFKGASGRLSFQGGLSKMYCICRNITQMREISKFC